MTISDLCYMPAMLAREADGRVSGSPNSNEEFLQMQSRLRPTKERLTIESGCYCRGRNFTVQ